MKIASMVTRDGGGWALQLRRRRQPGMFAIFDISLDSVPGSFIFYVCVCNVELSLCVLSLEERARVRGL